VINSPFIPLIKRLKLEDEDYFIKAFTRQMKKKRWKTTTEMFADVDKNIKRFTTDTNKLAVSILKAKGKLDADSLFLVSLFFQELFTQLMVDAYSSTVGRDVPKADILSLRLGDLTLSNALYKKAGLVASEVTKIINDHVNYAKSAKELAMMLYEGYGFNDREVLDGKLKLPAYLMNNSLSEDVDKIIEKLKTGNLQAGYLEYLDAVLKKKGHDSIKKAMDVAVHERYRYFAERIVRTEMMRLINDERQLEFLTDDRLEYVQVKMSKKHPRKDICDYHTGANLYGLGAGVYPKVNYPKPPFHPHCYCYVVQRLDVVGDAKYDEKEARRFFKRLSKEDAALVAGSKKKAEAILNGDMNLT
jgi:hypothetical protein